MKKFVSTKDFDRSNAGGDMPPDVAEAIAEVLSILDNCYGANRTDAQLGGYVLLVETAADMADVGKILCESVETAIAEVVDKLKSGYVRATYIINPDFSVTVLFPSFAVPSRLRE